MKHNPGFLKLVEAIRSRIKQMTIAEYAHGLMKGQHHVLIDVREDHEWARGHLPGAIHIGRGVLERDVETHFADKDTPIVLYCGGGFRSALSADALQQMGYTNVISLDGGYRGWVAADLPTEQS